jgi:leucyl/phenylalanyl-tRNA--protein transferase
MASPILCVSSRRLGYGFPDPEQALPEGLLALGGDLGSERLLGAYRRGIFPWYEDGQPILWWSPDPRCVFYPERFAPSRSLKRRIQSGTFGITVDRDFAGVIRACSQPRAPDAGTWLCAAMIEAYVRLHRQGHAHSVEAWQDGRLAGGLYGVAIGRVFFGESMFTRSTDASKVCLAHLMRRLSASGYRLVDCQIESPHLARLGATPIPRREFLGLIERWCGSSADPGAWGDPP